MVGKGPINDSTINSGLETGGNGRLFGSRPHLRVCCDIDVRTIASWGGFGRVLRGMKFETIA